VSPLKTVFVAGRIVGSCLHEHARSGNQPAREDDGRQQPAGGIALGFGSVWVTASGRFGLPDALNRDRSIHEQGHRSQEDLIGWPGRGRRRVGLGRKRQDIVRPSPK
jgi:hypothetical protein